jgi:hypothetical protein
MPRRRTPRRSAVVALLGCALVAGCGGKHAAAVQSVSARADVDGAHLAAAGWGLTLDGRSSAGSRLVLTRGGRSPASAAGAALRRLHDVHAGEPVGLAVARGALPGGGVRLTRRLSSPLPRGSRATLAYYDSAHDAWIGVPTAVSADRLTLSATVHHLSLWDDIEYGAGWLLDTRVSAPKCDGARPKWIEGSDAVVVLDDKNGPLRWCTGHDPKRPDVLVVKVAVNRSYGVQLIPMVKPEWSYDGLFQSGPEGFLTDGVAQFYRAFHRPAPRPGEAILLGGEEVDFGFTEAQVRSLHGSVLVKASLEWPEAIAGLTYTGLSKIAGGDALGKQVAAVVAIVGLAQCEAELAAPLLRGDVSGMAKGALRCLTDHADDVGRAIARSLTSALPKADPKKLGKLGGKIGGKLWQVWAAGEVFQVATLIADRHLLHNAFELHAFPTVVRKPFAGLSVDTSVDRQRISIAGHDLEHRITDAPYLVRAPNAPQLLAGALGRAVRCRPADPDARDRPGVVATYRNSDGGTVDVTFDAPRGNPCDPATPAVVRTIEVKGHGRVLSDAGLLRLGTRIDALASGIRDRVVNSTYGGYMSIDPCRAPAQASDFGDDDTILWADEDDPGNTDDYLISGLTLNFVDPGQCLSAPTRPQFEQRVLADPCALLGYREPDDTGLSHAACEAGGSSRVQVTRAAAAQPALSGEIAHGDSVDQSVRWSASSGRILAYGHGLRVEIESSGALDPGDADGVGAEVAARIATGIDDATQPDGGDVLFTATARGAQPGLGDFVLGSPFTGADTAVIAAYRGGRRIGTFALGYHTERADDAARAYGYLAFGATFDRICRRVGACP